MFDFAWSEIALIGVVALVAIGPKDLPVAIKTIAALIKKARRMAGEFQTHVDEMVKDANLSEVRDQISALRSLDIKGTIERAVDSDGSIRRTMNEDPLKTAYTPTVETPSSETVTGSSFATQDVGAHGAMPVATPAGVDAAPTMEEDTGGVPAFIPPAISAPPIPPAFIPPSAVRLAPRRAA